MLFVIYPLGELRVHHEVVDVLLGSSQFKFLCEYSNDEGCATRSLLKVGVYDLIMSKI